MLYQALLSKLQDNTQAIHNILDQNVRTELILNLSRQVSKSFHPTIATNIDLILHHYLSQEGADLDRIVKWLVYKTTNQFDHNALRREEKEDFDRLFGTKTSCTFEQFELQELITPERYFTASNYYPASCQAVKRALEVLGQHLTGYHDFAFIDIGSGLGRVLLLASEYQFKSLIGIEISPYLHAIAQANVAAYLSVKNKRSVIALECRDARTFEFPNDNLVLFFFNPFTQEVADSIFTNLNLSLQQKKRSAFLMFYGNVYSTIRESKRYNPICNLDGDELSLPTSIYSVISTSY